MKIKLAVSDDRLEEIRQYLSEKGIEIDDEATLILTERDHYVGHLTSVTPMGEKSSTFLSRILS